MNDLKYRFENNYLLGCIKHKNSYAIYSMPIAWWILNYKQYDPSYDPASWTTAYRDNIFNVSDDMIDDFIKSIQPDKVNTLDLKEKMRTIPAAYKRLCFFVDFDKKLFINGYFDNIEVEEYLPDENWEGKAGIPDSYIPEEMQSIFRF